MKSSALEDNRQHVPVNTVVFRLAVEIGLYTPVLSLTGYYDLRGFCYTPNPEEPRGRGPRASERGERGGTPG